MDGRVAVRWATALSRQVSDEQARALATFVTLVRSWNTKHNLTGARTENDLYDVLLADALVLSDERFVPRGARCVDVGSGAGAPAIPLLIMRPDISAVLVEPRQKRVAFLHLAVGSFDLIGRSRIVTGRVDLEKPDLAGMPFDVSMSRATFKRDDWLRAGLTLARRTVLFATSATGLWGAHARELATEGYKLPGSRTTRVVGAYEASIQS